MIRLISTMMVVCLPTISFADIYFCETGMWASVGQDGRYQVDDDTDDNYIVDTEKGIKWTGSRDSEIKFVDSCSRNEKFILCEEVVRSKIDGSIMTFDTFTIDLEQLTFTQIFNWGDEVSSFAGTCTEA